MTEKTSEFLAEQKRLAEDAQADSTNLYAHPTGEWTVKSSKRTIVAMDQLVDGVPRMIAALEAVQELHVESEWKCGNPRPTNPEIGCPECYTECETCDRVFPCDTFRAIEAALLGGEGE